MSSQPDRWVCSASDKNCIVSTHERLPRSCCELRAPTCTFYFSLRCSLFYVPHIRLFLDGLVQNKLRVLLVHIGTQKSGDSGEHFEGNWIKKLMGRRQLDQGAPIRSRVLMHFQPRSTQTSFVLDQSENLKVNLVRNVSQLCTTVCSVELNAGIRVQAGVSRIFGKATFALKHVGVVVDILVQQKLCVVFN